MKPNKIGLVLGGGGARGLAHVGVINVLHRAGIPIHIITGTSIGALIGGIYAQHPDMEILNKKVQDFLKGPRYKKLGVNNFKDKDKKDPDDLLKHLTRKVKRQLIINIAANRMALLKDKRLKIAIKSLLDDILIEDCKIPYACLATDLITGEAVVFDKGRMRPAVEGSSAIPGFLPPVEYNGYRLIDGSVSRNFPIATARQMGATSVITVDVALNFDKNVKIDNVIDLIIRTAQITAHHLDNHLIEHSDVNIKPDIGDVHWSEFNRVDELIKKGEEATEKILPDLERKISKKSSVIRKLFGIGKSTSE